MVSEAILNKRIGIAARTVATLHSVSRRFWFFHHEQWAGADATMRLHVDLAKALASGSEPPAIG